MKYGSSGHMTLPGQVTGSWVWHTDWPIKHLGPDIGLEIPPRSPLFETRCGLKGPLNNFSYVPFEYDKYCIACLDQAFIPYEVLDE